MPNQNTLDLHVPIPSTISSSSKRRAQTTLYQNRLHQLGYNAVAFSHEAYGKLNLNKDDADVALPWKDLVLLASSSSSDEKNGTVNSTIYSGSEDVYGSTSSSYSSSLFGRTNSLGMKIYRRLNIIVEEVSDVSSILVGGGGSTSSSISRLLQKYDIVSLQPMNEAALQNICELLSPSVGGGGGGGGGIIGAAASNNMNNNNNTSLIDIIVLEYATGSRGGFGLPYKLRKEYIVKALRAGVTFELSYSTAILDPKRRQGFLRTLTDFQSTYNGIQKKHLLLNNKNNNSNKQCGRSGTRAKNDTKFPLVLSSGPRQNYTRGSGDEGILAFRKLDDVKALVCHLVGGGGDLSWLLDNTKAGGVKEDDDQQRQQQQAIGGNGELDATRKSKKRKKKQQPVHIRSAAERVLARASDRALGVIAVVASMNRGGNKRNHVGRAHVVEAGLLGNTSDWSDDDDEEEGTKGTSNSLIDWLSEPLNIKKAKATGDAQDAKEVVTEPGMATKTDILSNLRALAKGGRGEIMMPNTAGKGQSKPCTMAGQDADNVSHDRENDGDGDEDEDDLEDGFITL